MFTVLLCLVLWSLLRNISLTFITIIITIRINGLKMLTQVLPILLIKSFVTIGSRGSGCCSCASDSLKRLLQNKWDPHNRSKWYLIEMFSAIFLARKS